MHKLKRRGAFTLVELLVVISIIGILAALLLPALSKARQQAQAAKCIANLKNMGNAMAQYAAANDQYLPCMNGWQAALCPYLGITENQLELLQVNYHCRPGEVDYEELFKDMEGSLCFENFPGPAEDDPENSRKEIRDYRFLCKTVLRCPSDKPGDIFGTEVAIGSYGINADWVMTVSTRSYWQGRDPYPGRMGSNFKITGVKMPHMAILVIDIACQDGEADGRPRIQQWGGYPKQYWQPWGDWYWRPGRRSYRSNIVSCLSGGFEADQNPFCGPNESSGWGQDGPDVAFRHNWKANALMFDGSVQVLRAQDTVGRAGTVTVPTPGTTTKWRELTLRKRGWLRGLTALGFIEHAYGTWFDEGGWED